MALKIFPSNALQRSVFRFNQKLSSCIYLKVIKYSTVHSVGSVALWQNMAHLKLKSRSS